MEDHLVGDAVALGRVIRDRRAALGLKQADLALVANVGVRFIVDAEKGKPTCQIGKFIRLLSVLDIRLTASVPDSRRPLYPAFDDDMGGLDP